jgi:hypothetical protein
VQCAPAATIIAVCCRQKCCAVSGTMTDASSAQTQPASSLATSLMVMVE